MKHAPLISLGLSLVLGAGAIVLGRGYMNAEKNAADAQVVSAPAIVMATVLVASDTIDTGALIEPAMVKTVEWPADLVPEGAIRDLETLGETAYSRGLITPGEPIMTAKIDPTGGVLTLAASIKPGMRAVSIVVENDTGVAGFVLPGDRVDVNEFVPSDSAGARSGDPSETRVSGDLIARSVLKDVVVLAIDQSFESGLEGAFPSNTVTLEVTPQDALAIGAASQRGALGLALIGRKEEAAVAAVERKTPRRVASSSVKRSPTTTTVRVINGTVETSVTAPVARPAAKAEGAE